MSDAEASSCTGQKLTDEAMKGLIPFAGTLGIELVSAEPGRVEGRLAWSQEMCTAGGVLHGEALMAMADTFGAVCAH
jgi:acyl-coenzyme A thioesterase PaaI-like protein